MVHKGGTLKSPPNPLPLHSITLGKMSTIYTKMGKVGSSNSQQEEEGRKEGRKKKKPN